VYSMASCSEGSSARSNSAWSSGPRPPRLGMPVGRGRAIVAAVVRVLQVGPLVCLVLGSVVLAQPPLAPAVVASNPSRVTAPLAVSSSGMTIAYRTPNSLVGWVSPGWGDGASHLVRPIDAVLDVAALDPGVCVRLLVGRVVCWLGEALPLVLPLPGVTVELAIVGEVVCGRSASGYVTCVDLRRDPVTGIPSPMEVEVHPRDNVARVFATGDWICVVSLYGPTTCIPETGNGRSPVDLGEVLSVAASLNNDLCALHPLGGWKCPGEREHGLALNREAGDHRIVSGGATICWVDAGRVSCLVRSRDGFRGVSAFGGVPVLAIEAGGPSAAVVDASGALICRGCWWPGAGPPAAFIGFETTITTLGMGP